ncbi:MAG: protein kinase, partial [candidate division Zixibacteria bacterium]|nr:protein kinase [candidate division Zixibacteria bacterium]
MPTENRDDDKTRSVGSNNDRMEETSSDDKTMSLSDRTADLGEPRDDRVAEHFGSLRSGTRVFHYQLVGHIGSGGMGEVYLANDTRLDRKVALKFLAPKLSTDREFRSRFKREAQAIAQINHPNVVTIYEVADFDERPFLAMEYVTGKPLTAMIREGGMPLNETVDIAIQICEGVREAHNAGIVHRDLKPANIVATDTGHVKILDFGLAKRLGTDSVDKHGRIEGTISYMSPEQVSGSELSTATDIFSFGVVLYELLTGKRPFERETANAVMYAILHEDPISPCDLKPELPGWADVLSMKLLSKNLDDRFGSMQEVASFLDSVKRGIETTVDDGSFRKRRMTVTVIDLNNLSGDSSWDYFCKGFTGDLIREISRRTDLIVSAEPLISQRYDIKSVFRRYRSDYAVTGTLMKWQGRTKLSLSCYGDKGDSLFFGEDYEGKSEELFILLSKAAKEVSTALASESGASSVSVEDAVVTDISAYDYYLKGLSYYQTNRPEDLDFAAGMFSKSLELDSEFALAHAGLSDVHTFQYMAYYDRSPEKITTAKQEALRALEINPKLPEAHRSLGRYYQHMGDFACAERSLLKAVEISPKYAVGYRTLAWLSEARGSYKDALRWASKALELAPTDLETLLLISEIHIYEKKFTLAIATLTRTLEIGPDYGRAYYILGVVYSKMGALDAALENLQLSAKYKGNPNCYVDAG